MKRIANEDIDFSVFIFKVVMIVAMKLKNKDRTLISKLFWTY